MWYRTMTAILLRRERGGGGGGGGNNAEIYAVLVVTPPPPTLQREVTFQKGGRNDARVRYIQVQTKGILYGRLGERACIEQDVRTTGRLNDRRESERE